MNGLLIIILVIAALTLGPLALIFGLNLLGFSVPLTWGTWFGAVLILSVLREHSIRGAVNSK